MPEGGKCERDGRRHGRSGLAVAQVDRKGLTEMLTLGQRSTGSQGESKVASGRSAFQAMAARMRLLR